jgi:hypothetical protein
MAYYNAANSISAEAGITTNLSGTITCTNVIATSDERLKINIRVIENALDKVNQLRGVLFTRISDNEENIGVIAQDLIPIIPEAVRLHPNGYYGVAYGNLVGLLIEAIKDLKKEVDFIKKS